MDQGTWAGLGVLAGGIVTSLGKVAWDKRKHANGNGNGNGIAATLARIEHEVADRDGSVRSGKHDLSQPLQGMVINLELLRQSSIRSEEYLKSMAEGFAYIKGKLDK